MECKEFKRGLDSYFDQELTIEEEFELDLHKKACPDCRKFFHIQIASQMICRGIFGDDMRGKWATVIPPLRINGEDQQKIPWASNRIIVVSHVDEKKGAVLFYFYVRRRIYNKTKNYSGKLRITVIILGPEKNQDEAILENTFPQGRIEFLLDQDLVKKVLPENLYEIKISIE